MNRTLRRTFQTVVSATAVLLAGCSSKTTIQSDLVLDPSAGARIELHQDTQAIELLNESVAQVHVLVLGKRDKVISKMSLSPFDQARLDLQEAKALKFENGSSQQAVVHWTLQNNDRIEYSLAMTPPVD